MKITITSSTIVKPAKETPQCTLWNSNVDLVIPRIHVPTVYFYKAKGEEHREGFFASGQLKESLGRALVPFYPMAGRLKEVERGRIDIECNGKGALFVEATADGCMSEYGDYFAPSMKMRQLIPYVDYAKDRASFPLLILQLTVFKCGGVSLGVGVHHHVADGLAALRFLNYWADLARGIEENANPFFDRTLLRARDPPRPKFGHVEYQPSPPLLTVHEGDVVNVSDANCKVNGDYSEVNGDYSNMNREYIKVNGDCNKVNGDFTKEQKACCKNLRGQEEREEHQCFFESIAKIKEEKKVNEEETYPIAAELFVFSSEQVLYLKNKATEHAIPGDRPFTSYEVLSAHVWRCTCLARDLQEAQPTKLYIATDGRSRLQPPLPSDYFGNVIFTAAPVEHVGRLVNAPLADAARLIRKTVQIMDDEYLRSALDYLDMQPNLEVFSRGAHTFRSPNLGITSWVRLPIYGADFGWGPPLSMGPAGVPFEGLAYLLPGPPGDPRLRLSITLSPNHMQCFRELIYQF
eukprot:c22587_g1_i1 orf=803-2362(+)